MAKFKFKAPTTYKEWIKLIGNVEVCTTLNLSLYLKSEGIATDMIKTFNSIALQLFFEPIFNVIKYYVYDASDVSLASADIKDLNVKLILEAMNCFTQGFFEQEIDDDLANYFGGFTPAVFESLAKLGFTKLDDRVDINTILQALLMQNNKG